MTAKEQKLHLNIELKTNAIFEFFSGAWKYSDVMKMGTAEDRNRMNQRNVSNLKNVIIS